MRVLTVFAHHGSGSSCHSVLDRFDAGPRDARRPNEIVDLYAIEFDPVRRDRDNANWMAERRHCSTRDRHGGPRRPSSAGSNACSWWDSPLA